MHKNLLGHTSLVQLQTKFSVPIGTIGQRYPPQGDTSFVATFFKSGKSGIKIDSLKIRIS